ASATTLTLVCVTASVIWALTGVESAMDLSLWFREWARIRPVHGPDLQRVPAMVRTVGAQGCEPVCPQACRPRVRSPSRDAASEGQAQLLAQQLDALARQWRVDAESL